MSKEKNAVEEKNAMEEKELFVRLTKQDSVVLYDENGRGVDQLLIKKGVGVKYEEGEFALTSPTIWDKGFLSYVKDYLDDDGIAIIKAEIVVDPKYKVLSAKSKLLRKLGM